MIPTFWGIDPALLGNAFHVDYRTNLSLQQLLRRHGDHPLHSGRRQNARFGSGRRRRWRSRGRRPQTRQNDALALAGLGLPARRRYEARSELGL